MNSTTSNFKLVLEAYEAARSAQTPDDYEEAMAELDFLARKDISLAILSTMAKIQIERPVLIPLVILLGSTSLALSISRMFSAH